MRESPGPSVYSIPPAAPTADRDRRPAGPVRIGTCTDAAAWDAFVLLADDGTVAHRWAWLGIVPACYGHRVVPMAAFRGDASFPEATFREDALFDEATFRRVARFHSAAFGGLASFQRATFGGVAGFRKTTFIGDTGFGETVFGGDAWFDKATFRRGAVFDEAAFGGDAGFGEAAFGGAVWFGAAAFSGGAGALHFERARILSPGASHMWPTGWRLADADGGGYAVVRANDDRGS